MSDKLARLLFLSSYLPIDKMTNAWLIPNPVGSLTVLGEDATTITAVTVLAEIYPGLYAAQKWKSMTCLGISHA